MVPSLPNAVSILVDHIIKSLELWLIIVEISQRMFLSSSRVQAFVLHTLSFKLSTNKSHKVLSRECRAQTLCLITWPC
jgi:hypothetical protein